MTSTNPRWFLALSEALNKNIKSTIYTIATVDASVNPPVPRVRSIVHRTFIHPTPKTPLLISTTDIRTPKINELTSITGFERPNAEICWWLQDASEQYRLSGVIHILPRPDHPLTPMFPAERLAPKTAEDGSPFDWEQERVRTFNEKMGGPLRAGFARPTPGSLLERYADADKWPTTLPKTYEVEKGDEKTRSLVEEAVKNFALLVMEPITVERVELGVVPNRRTKFEREGQEWKETIVVP